VNTWRCEFVVRYVWDDLQLVKDALCCTRNWVAYSSTWVNWKMELWWSNNR